MAYYECDECSYVWEQPNCDDEPDCPDTECMNGYGMAISEGLAKELGIGERT